MRIPLYAVLVVPSGLLAHLVARSGWNPLGFPAAKVEALLTTPTLFLLFFSLLVIIADTLAPPEKT